MLDFGERVYSGALFNNGKTGLEMHNLYPYFYYKAYNEAWTELIAAPTLYSGDVPPACECASNGTFRLKRLFSATLRSESLALQQSYVHCFPVLRNGKWSGMWSGKYYDAQKLRRIIQRKAKNILI